MKVALFKSMEHGFEALRQQKDEKYSRGYVRISEYVDVDFPPLNDERIVQQQIDALDKLADEKTEQYRRFMAGIDERRSKLLAITHQA